MSTVTVTWMDGTQEKYRTQEWRVENDRLWLTSPNDISEPARCIPLCNVKIWTVS